MKLNRLAATLAAAMLCASQAQAQTEIQWWHSMGGALGEGVNELANKFNASQKEYKVVPVFKGSYPESMTAAIAAFRAGNAPHILQVFEVGTATMMAAKGADRAGDQGDGGRQGAVRSQGLPADRWRATTPTQGQHAVVPLQQLDRRCSTSTRTPSRRRPRSEKAPKTWKEFGAAAEKLKASGQQCVYTTGWPSWMHIENFSAWHNVPIGTKQNGMARHRHRVHASTRRCTCATSRCWPTWRRRACSPTPAAPTRPTPSSRAASARCSPSAPARRPTSGGNAKFDWSVNFIPYHDDVKGAPQNSIIGGASLWVMSGKKPDGVQGRGEVLRVPVAARDPDGLAHQRPATCRSPWPRTS